MPKTLTSTEREMINGILDNAIERVKEEIKHFSTGGYPKVVATFNAQLKALRKTKRLIDKGSEEE